MDDMHENGASRRRFIGSAAIAGGAAALGFPRASRGAESGISLRFQSTWPTKDIFHEYALDYAKKVNDMSGGRLRIEVLPSGSVVKAFDLIDAVHKGVLDGGHGVCAYWYGKNSAYSLFGTSPLSAMNAHQMLGWMEYGGGRALYDELHHNIMKLEVEGFLYGPMPTQPLGWFTKEIKTAADLKGLRYRTVGLAIDLFKEMGAAALTLPAGEIVPGFDRGTIDAAEFNNASSDRTLGLPEVAKICMLQSYHQPAECFEVLFNRQKYNSLPPELKSILRYAAQASSSDMSWKAMDRYSKDYLDMQRAGVRFIRTPPDVLQAQLKAWNTVIANKTRDNPFFGRVLESQKKWAQRVVGWSLDTNVSVEPAYAHWFGSRKA